MSEPTKGEWMMKRGQFDSYLIQHKNERGNTDTIAIINDFNRFDREAEVKANADLFFNARETLDALEALTSITAMDTDPVFAPTEKFLEVHAQAVAAIEKVKGK